MTILSFCRTFWRMRHGLVKRPVFHSGVPPVGTSRMREKTGRKARKLILCHNTKSH
jgi:hypothetical protein